jgi:hypothetical protein
MYDLFPCTRSDHLLLLIILLLDWHSLHLMLFHNGRSGRSCCRGAHTISETVSVDGDACFESSQTTYLASQERR